MNRNGKGLAGSSASLCSAAVILGEGIGFEIDEVRYKLKTIHKPFPTLLSRLRDKDDRPVDVSTFVPIFAQPILP